MEAKKLSWEEYVRLVNLLFLKIVRLLTKKKLKVNVLVPILREGGFTGLILSFKLNNYRIMPLQFKYIPTGNDYPLTQVSELPKVHFKVPANAVFLVVDTLSFSGKTAESAAKKIRKRYPKSTLIHATVFRDAQFRESPSFDAYVYAKMTDGMRLLSASEARQKGIRKREFMIMPWGIKAEELAVLNKKKYDYA